MAEGLRQLMAHADPVGEITEWRIGSHEGAYRRYRSSRWQRPHRAY
jgi:hypothetical protein